jgi:hypothetical protein
MLWDVTGRDRIETYPGQSGWVRAVNYKGNHFAS